MKQHDGIQVWNTGRLYAREGQVIAAKQVAGGVVFNDVSRYIDGFVAASPERIAREGIRAVAMWGYDTGEPTDGGGFKYNYARCIPSDDYAAYRAICAELSAAATAFISAQ